MTYPEHPERIGELEERMLDRWREEDLFRRTLEAREGAEEFVFYEGPPTANGRPGIHHVLSRTIKDLVCRYQTMRGRHVTRIAGWDTHGLPVEIEAEKKLGISGKGEIEEIGVERFNEVCRDSVFTYQEEWERLSERIGYWLDYTDPYITYGTDYIESVWNIIRRLDERDLLYRGHKIVPYCPRCGTGLSSHEVAQGYEEVLDPSLYFLCPLEGPDGGEDPEGRALLVWTTTPWTLVSNTAVAVHPELEYVEVEHEGRRLILAEARLDDLFGEDAEVVRRYGAEELTGRRYVRPLDLVPADAGEGAAGPEDRGTEAAWTVVVEDFVSAEEGTGIVHMAPAFGEDDYEAGRRHGLPVFRPVGDDGTFDEELDLVGGLFVKAADEVVVEDLERRGLLFRHTLEPHTYPHCWRCSSPLLYLARDSWYIRTTELKDRMIANNRAVEWHPPEVGTGRFGEWLEGNVDWALSRDRYWGTPLPAWICDRSSEHVEFIGSYGELADRAGPLPEDFDPHKPWIDEYTWACPECDGTMRRTPEVIDVWFDSGSMPYAQWHYPVENEESWRRHFPADFICEGVDQTRGWFYSLLAISTMLGDGPAYRNVVVNDLVLDAEGRKMSKSRGNTVEPWQALEELGADAIRWYFMVGSQPWVPKRFDPDAVAETARRTFDTLANSYRFFALYANLEEWQAGDEDPPPAERPVMDRWVLSRLNRLVAGVNRDMEGYDLTRAARAVGDFIVDDLSNWYVRRSRSRFWGSVEDDGSGASARSTRAAFRTLRDILATVAKLLAPFAPFRADWLHRALRDGASVHLARIPDGEPERMDDALEGGMSTARTLARLGRSAREGEQLRVRQPLRVLYAALPDGEALEPELVEVVKDELNVKEVRFLESADEVVALRAKPDFSVLGPRFGARTNAVAESIRALGDEELQAFRAGEPVTVVVEGDGVDLTGDEFELRREARGDLVMESDAGVTIALDPTVDETLQREGLARELINRIQRLRRDAGLEVHDRIRLAVVGGQDVEDAVRDHGGYITRETLAERLETDGEATDGRFTAVRDVEIDGIEARIALSAV